MTRTSKRSYRKSSQFFLQLYFFVVLFSPFYLHIVRVVYQQYERLLQIEYLRETKHTSNTSLRKFLYRKFVFTRTRISVRKKPFLVEAR